ncbi:gluconokinase [Phycicoccus sp. CMS6Z-2]|nr:gluconokinase [Phycicoccus flavus]
MGVSGSGKTVLASLVAGKLGWRFCEADEVHPAANVEKMSRGVPLTDEDRLPWLETLAAWIREQAATGHDTVTACSALKRSYRDVLRRGAPDLLFVHVDGDPDLIIRRMNAREHFMPGSLLRSQLDTLEPLQDDEVGVVIDLDQSVEEELAEALAWLRPRTA